VASSFFLSTLILLQDKVGQLGHGERCDQMEPLPVQVFSGFRILQVACGMSHTIFLSEDCRVFACGKGGGGRLGTGDSPTVHNTPVLINSRHFLAHPNAGKESRANFVFSGHAHSGAVCKDGAVYMWGHASRGQLGLDTDVSCVNFPKFVDALGREVIVAAAAGYSTSLFLNDAGDVFSCGTCKWGSHGHGCSVMVRLPQLAPELCGKHDAQVLGHGKSSTCAGIPVAKVSCGVGHAAALTRDGSLLLWGCNLYGQCATGGDIVEVPRQFGRSARLHSLLNWCFFTGCKSF
jgi:alpha-tubulin suppressor-like RCC1 family protein